MVRELRMEGHRLQYCLVEGFGPREGWVSIRIKDAVLLLQEPLAAENTAVKAAAASFKPRIYSSKDLNGKAELDTSWSPVEKALFYQSCGRWDPDQLRSLRGPVKAAGPLVPKPKKVSVLTPTSRTRTKFHQQLWTCFNSQSWTDKELVIIDSAQGSPSSFFSRICRQFENVVYVGLDGDFSIGCKRNLGAYLASGDVIVHFDDDDVYGPSYIASMVAELDRRNLVALTLSAWYDFDLRLGRCGFVDPEALHDVDLVAAKTRHPKIRQFRDSGVEAAIYGYGFSYVYLRRVAMFYPFTDTNMCEDVDFFLRLKEVYDYQVGLKRDQEGLCLHIMHGDNTADSMLHREVHEIAKLHVCELNLPFLAKMEGETASKLTGEEHHVRLSSTTGRFFVKADSEQRMRAFQAVIQDEVSFAAQCLERGVSLRLLLLLLLLVLI